MCKKKLHNRYDFLPVTGEKIELSNNARGHPIACILPLDCLTSDFWIWGYPHCVWIPHLPEMKSVCVPENPPIHTHAHTHTHTHTHAHARTHTHTHTHAHARTHTHTHTHKLAIAILWEYPFVLSIVYSTPTTSILPPHWWRNKGHHCVLLFKYLLPLGTFLLPLGPHTHTHTHTYIYIYTQQWKYPHESQPGVGPPPPPPPGGRPTPGETRTFHLR